jgi:hypothetical protein
MGRGETANLEDRAVDSRLVLEVTVVAGLFIETAREPGGCARPERGREEDRNQPCGGRRHQHEWTAPAAHAAISVQRDRGIERGAGAASHNEGHARFTPG